MNRHAVIISLKFAPGLPKEFFVIGDCLKANGWFVSYILCKQYEGYLTGMMLNNDIHYIATGNSMFEAFFKQRGRIVQQICDTANSIAKAQIGYICFYNPHPLNGQIMKQLEKKYPESKRAVVLHEPYVPIRERHKYGKVFGPIKMSLLDIFSYSLLHHCTDVILPSEHAMKLYKMRPVHIKNVNEHVIPLMLPPDNEPLNLKREPYVAFVGTINNARRVDEIFAAALNVFAEYPQIRFKVLTRQDVESKLPNVEIIRKKVITDHEISDFLKNAYAVFLTHSVAAQSGNIPVAYRVGTPVIGFTVDGISQHIKNKQTGCLIHQEQFEKDMVAAIGYISGHIDEMIYECRSYFDTYFSGKLAGARYAWVNES